MIVAKELIQQSGSRWSDERDVKVLDSIQRDLAQFGSVLGAQRAPAPVERLAWDMEKHVQAIGEFADTLVMISTCPDMGRTLCEHYQPNGGRRRPPPPS